MIGYRSKLILDRKDEIVEVLLSRLKEHDWPISYGELGKALHLGARSPWKVVLDAIRGDCDRKREADITCALYRWNTGYPSKADWLKAERPDEAQVKVAANLQY